MDRTITDIQAANRRLILESTGLQTLLEDMIRQSQRSREEEYTQQVVQNQQLKELLEFKAEDGDIEVESDDEAVNADFSEDEQSSSASNTIVIKTSGEVN